MRFLFSVFSLPRVYPLISVVMTHILRVCVTDLTGLSPRYFLRAPRRRGDVRQAGPPQSHRARHAGAKRRERCPRDARGTLPHPAPLSSSSHRCARSSLFLTHHFNSSAQVMLELALTSALRGEPNQKPVAVSFFLQDGRFCKIMVRRDGLSEKGETALCLSE